MIPRTRLGSFALIAICAARAGAMDPDRVMSQYVRDAWGSDKGLAGEVHAIAQTTDGYLWIGTEKGLFRFDGSDFRPTPGSGSSAILNTSVIGLAVNAQGTLMVRPPERNLLRYAGAGFENILYSLQPRELAITAMCRGKDGDILIAGLLNGVLRYAGGQLQTVAAITALPPSPVIAMAQSSDGRIWLGTRDAGLLYIDQGRAVPVKGFPSSRKINALLAAGPDVWIGTDAGMMRWNGTAITAYGVPVSLRRAPILSMLADRQANLWVGSNSGLLRVNYRGSSSLKVRAAAVNALFEDREGNLWTGGPQGIERWRDSDFSTYGETEGLPSDNNGPIYADSEGRIWFAPHDGGLYWLARDQRVQRVEGIGTDVVYSIGGNNGELWIGRQRGGLTRVRVQGDAASIDTFTEASGSRAKTGVYSVYQSRDGRRVGRHIRAR